MANTDRRKTRRITDATLATNPALETTTRTNLNDMEKPLTSEANFEQRRFTAKEVAAKNKSRAKSMEREVAKYLGGERTPMSGAGSTKGDVRVMFTNRPGHYMIECKLSAQLSERLFPVIRMRFEWLTKMHEEAVSMRSLFAVLIIKYLSIHDKFVLVKAEDLHKVYTPLDVPVTDWTAKNPKGISIKVQQFRAMIGDNGVGLLKIPLGDYYVLTLEMFRSIMRHV